MGYDFDDHERISRVRDLINKSDVVVCCESHTCPALLGEQLDRAFHDFAQQGGWLVLFGDLSDYERRGVWPSLRFPTQRCRSTLAAQRASNPMMMMTNPMKMMLDMIESGKVQ